MVMNSETAWSEISNCIIETAKQTLTKIDQNQRREYLSQETWQKIVERQQAHESGNLEVVQELSNKIKNLARRDKRRAVFDSIIVKDIHLEHHLENAWRKFLQGNVFQVYT